MPRPLMPGVLVAAVAMAACAELPPARLTVDPAQWVAYREPPPDAATEARVLEQLVPVAAGTMRRVWGVPGGDTAWTLRVGPAIAPWGSPEDAAPGDGERARARRAFRAALARELRPTAHVDERASHERRSVNARMRRTGDTVRVALEIGAGRTCPEPFGDVTMNHAFGLVFLRDGRRWRLAAGPEHLHVVATFGGEVERCRPVERDPTILRHPRLRDASEGQPPSSPPR